MTKFVLTGAAGALGSVLRGPLSQMCDELLSTDIVDEISDLAPNERFVQADVSQRDQIGPLLEGADMVIHFASIADEAPFEELLGPNFIGAYNIWESAHEHGVRRIIYASSVHAVGMHNVNDGIDLDAPHRPDTYYGLAKCFTEDLARMHWEKRGIECVAIRIFSCSPEPGNARALGSWLSYGDLIQLVQRGIEAPTVGYTAIFGISGNTRGAVNNAKASYLGYVPQDNAEYMAAELLAKAGKLDPQDPQHMKLGGPFAIVPLGESGVAMIKRLSEGNA
ncbi:NAD-dependent epimerase/dehydratase family protein [Flavimaricola marinus]|uniref:dTDP-glucose 4,6-dehydratase n=1 Tax=Flavimaricola marinus TaxID=1819565 RepID=A0A238L9Q7_9RHOB|nr:NAD(P)-dependent oxidoreductase [Flavimaricola marinus]SMY06145.1 dTDP-glucose 4,6-dehydratase [Flavimaricola marinus]